MEFLLHSLARKVRNIIIDRKPTNTRGYNEAWEMNHFSEKKKKCLSYFLNWAAFLQP